MKMIDNIIKQKFGTHSIHDYNNVSLRNLMSEKISNEINEYIPSISSVHSLEDENNLKENGYIKIDNFLSSEEVVVLKNHLIDKTGYNAHVPLYSDQVLRKFSTDYPFNTLSYPLNVLLENEIILNKIIDNKILSLAQNYLGCFPTLYSLNSWWHIYKGDIYATQKNHRDHDDFKFLALFIYLTDVDENTGPHIFYPKTQNGGQSNESIAILGKAGTAILADTFAIHRGEPLKQGSRLVCWWRYGLNINAMHYHDGNDKFKVEEKSIFNNIPKTEHNEYLFRAFIK